MKPRGFTLVEVVVALLILEVGLLGVFGMVVLAQRTLAQADAIERGVAELEGLLDSLGVHAAPGGGSRELDVGVVHWSVTADGTVTVRFVPALGLGEIEVLGRVAVTGGASP